MGITVTHIGNSIAAAVLLLLACYLCFTNLDKTISPSDESLHVKVIQEMYHSGQWWLPTHEGQPYFRKPPFKMWLTFIPLAVFGESNFSYRVIDATLGVLLVGGVLLFATVALESFWAGWLAGFFLLMNRAFLISSHGYRHATQDPMLHVLQFVALVLFYVWVRRFWIGNTRPAWWLAGAFGLVIGISVLTKNVLGFMAPGLCFLFLCSRLELLQFVRRYWRESLMAFGLAIAIPALYMVPHFLLTPGAFENLFLSEVVERASQGQHNSSRPFYYFEKFYRWEFIPIPLLLVAFIGGLYLSLVKRDPRSQLLLIWAVVPILILSFVPSRLLWYIADSYPAITLLFGLSVAYWLRWCVAQRNNLLVLVPSLIGLLILIYPLVSYLPRIWKQANRIDRRIALDRAVDVIREFPEGRVLVYASLFDWEEKYRCRVEKIYIGMLGRRVTLVDSMPEFLQEAARPDYAFAIAPREGLEDSRRAFRPDSFVRLLPFHHRNQKAFLLSRIATGSSLFEPSAPIDEA